MRTSLSLDLVAVRLGRLVARHAREVIPRDPGERARRIGLVALGGPLPHDSRHRRRPVEGPGRSGALNEEQQDSREGAHESFILPPKSVK